MSHRPALLLVTALLCAGTASAAPEDEIRAAFERFVVAQNAHDPATVRVLLIDRPEFLWITRGAVVWGPDAAMQRFEALYQGTWKLVPDPAGPKIVAVAKDVYQMVAAVTFRVGAAGQNASDLPFQLTQLWVHDEQHGWRIASLLPVPSAGPR